MKRSICMLAAAAAMAVGSAAAQADTWNAWGVNGAFTIPGPVVFLNAGPGAGPWSDDPGNGLRNGGKAFYSTSDYNGRTLSDILSINATNPNGLDPYINIVVQDGSGNKGILLLTGGVNGSGYGGNLLSADSFTMNEETAPVTGTAGPLTNGNVYSYNDVKNLTIAPGGFQAFPVVDPGWSSPLDHVQDGIDFVWGNKGNLAAYQVGPGTLSDVSVSAVPLPKSAWGGLALIGGLGLVTGAKRMRRQEA